MEITYQPIGIVHSPFKQVENIPIQTSGAQGIKGSIEIYPMYIEGLKDLDGFSHIFLIYHFHLVYTIRMTVIPFLDTKKRGVFSTRAPTRPNSIGLSVVRLLNVEHGTLHIENVDLVDGTPLLDIKPYVPIFDVHPTENIGWLGNKVEDLGEKRSDERFS